MDDETKSVRADGYAIHTSQEIDALGRATASGKSFNGYQSFEQGGTVTYEHGALSHRVQLELSDAERSAGMSIESLEALVREQDSDAFITQLYIMSVLAPATPVPSNMSPTGWIDFDDVIEKIGWSPRTTQQRRDMHKRINEFVRFGERAAIIGRRSKGYKNRATGDEIDTEIRAAVWRVMKDEIPAQGELFDRIVPFRLQIALTSDVARLITAPQTAQYLPLGEVLGAIPGNKPSGAWARVLGLSLASFWRRCPREALVGEIKPTRRELLDHFPSKLSPYQELVTIGQPNRIIEYWVGALEHLSNSGFIAREGEPQRTVEAIKADLPRQGWLEKWLGESVLIKPGSDMHAHMEGRIKALPVAHEKRRRGRPRKLN